MVRNADGSVIIDTELDSSAVESNVAKIESLISSFVSTVNRIGANLSETFSGYFKEIGTTAQQSGSGVIDMAQQATRGQAAAAKATSEYDKQLNALQEQIDAAKGKLSDYYQALDRIHEFTDEALQYATTDADAGDVLDTEQVQLARINEKYAEKLSVLYELEAEYARVAEARDAALQAPVDDTDSTEGQAAANGIRAIGSAEESVAPETLYFSVMLTGLKKTLQTVAGHALSLGKRFAQIGFNAVAAGAKKAANGLKAFISFARKAVSGLKSLKSQTRKTDLSTMGLVKSLTSLKRLLITRIKRMFISAIFNNVREGSVRTLTGSQVRQSRMSGRIPRLSREPLTRSTPLLRVARERNPQPRRRRSEDVMPLPPGDSPSTRRGGRLVDDMKLHGSERAFL